ncbi:MAG: hypothetical protein J6V14_05940 [Clostridia bacterium]|nr:hypothetical protein [Clostridia bacterium]
MKRAAKWIIRIITMCVLLPALLAGMAGAGVASAANTEADAEPEPERYGGVDGLGRILPAYEDLSKDRPQKTRYVGMFFWDWHNFFSVHVPMNVTEIIAAHPEAANDFNHEAWGGRDSGTPYFWNEPIYGYYSSTDEYVLRKQAELLADAGVDVLFLDCTNGTELYLAEFKAIVRVFEQAAAQGVNVPKLAFMLNINPNTLYDNNPVELRQLYRQIYKKEVGKELWFYWEGKPLVLSPADCLDAEKDRDILDYFTFRRSDDSFFTADTDIGDNIWGWLSVYPQTRYGVRPDGSVEEMAVGVAQNANEFGMKGSADQKYGLTAMNDPRGTVHGRAFTEGEYGYVFKTDSGRNGVSTGSPDALLYGLNFQQQWDRAIEIDPDIVFVTGWNEWIAGRWDKWGGGDAITENAFPDEYTDEFSRDIEPSKGVLKDHYYYQLAANIRRYKGVPETRLYTEAHTIDIGGAPAQWDGVDAVFVHSSGNTPKRSKSGYKGVKFESDTMRNDIVRAKVAYDDANVYFLVETAETLTAPEGNAWMRLLLRTRSGGETWEGFDYIVNRVSPSAPDAAGQGTATLEKSTGGWNWAPAGEVRYRIADNTLQLEIPRALLGLADRAVNLEFKWTDNTQADGDIMDFYLSGDVAPGGRFTYVFRSEPVRGESYEGDVESIPVAKRSSTLPAYVWVGFGAAAAALAAMTVVLIRNRKKK